MLCPGVRLASGSHASQLTNVGKGSPLRPSTTACSAPKGVAQERAFGTLGQNFCVLLGQTSQVACSASFVCLWPRQCDYPESEYAVGELRELLPRQ